jgi:hypothetical protein
MADYWKPDRAQSLGLITNYRCTFHCRHCLYCASPAVQEDPEEERLNRLVDHLTETLGPVPIHIGGGEPLLHFERLERLLRRISQTRLQLEYVETNGSTLLTDTEQKIHQLRQAGLNCLLVSLSPFHNEFIAFQDLARVIRMVVDGLGPEGLFPWHAGYLPFLEKAGTEAPLPLKRYWGFFSAPEIIRQLTSVMYIHPGGRAARLLARHLGGYPAEALLGAPCRRNLASPVHAHVDYQGNYLTGFCSGLRLGKESAENLPQLYGRGLELGQYPVLEMLLQGGLRSLYGYALGRGFEPDAAGYGSSCHLCLELRVFLYHHGCRFPEFYPDFLYEELGPLKGGVPSCKRVSWE